MENAPNAENPTTSADSSAATFMVDLMQKFGGPVEAMKAFVMFTTMMEKTTPTASTTTAPPPPQISEDSTAQPAVVHAVAEPSASAPTEDAAIGAEQGQEADLTAGVEQIAAGDRRVARVVEGKTPVISASGCEGETHVGIEGVTEGEPFVGVLEGETPVISASVLEGETPVIVEGLIERETPVFSEKTVEEETPERLVGGEALISDPKVAEGGTPVYIEGVTPMLSEGGDALILDNVSEPKESGPNLVIDLDDNPMSADSPVDKRAARRRAQRNLSDEIEDLTLPTTEGELEAEAPRSGGEQDVAEEHRLAAERKRKGKHAATSWVKKSKQTREGKALEAQLLAPTKVPFAKELAGPPSSSDPEEEDIEEPEEELNFEPAEVWITNGLLEAMGKFEDPKRKAAYKERCGSGKLAKSEK
ncbi:uncharacterized protein LOC121774342 [Salvia splendens]|uniref:uncharacterized protein LOC121774342 n=1 Tax=Salvia splendens TaxID=180675 RepID=UPI001C25F726|nr:uncharacterized protein LOC121774342 [Salvia splendens]